jgi:hypothetical protein
MYWTSQVVTTKPKPKSKHNRGTQTSPYEEKVKKFFWQYWGSTQGFMLGRQAFYHLSHTPSPFCFSYFLDRVFFLGPVLDHDPPSYASCVFWITGVYHHAWLVGWHESLLTFCLGWPQAMIFWISTSQVAEITDVHHSTWLIFFFSAENESMAYAC